jgi:hypothetical protein
MSDELYKFECQSCDAEYTGKPHELTALGWKHHEYPRVGMRRKAQFLLCVDCEKYYAVIWEHNKKRAA